MRLVKLTVREDQRDAVLSVLDEENIDYVLIEQGGTDGETLVEFPLPDQAVEYITDRLDERGLGEGYLITLTAEAAQTDRFEELEERFITGTEQGDSIPTDELRTTALDLQPDPLPYYTMTLLSAIVAVSGLLLDSAALVVGAMVIAPQVGSALMASVGGTIADWEMIQRGVREQILSLLLAIVGATVFGLLLQNLGFISPVVNPETITEVGERVSPGLLVLAVGLAAGMAGAIGLATALPVSLVGVMVAAALIPAAATTGIGIAWNSPLVAVGAFVVLLTNTIAINIAGYLTLRAFGYRSRDSDPDPDFNFVKKAVLGGLLLTVVLFCGGMLAMQLQFENDVNEAADAVLEQEEYDTLELSQVRADFVLVPGTGEPTVTIVVSKPVSEQYPHLATDLAERISSATDRDVGVQVQMTERQESDPPSQARVYIPTRDQTPHV